MITQVRDDIKAELLKYHKERNLSHLGSCLSSLDVLTALFWGPLEPQDHFILSKGHAVSLLYVILHKKRLLSDNEFSASCLDGSVFGAHPPFQSAAHPWWGFGSGSLGYGTGLACGVALAKKIRGDQSQIYVLISEGDLNEGSTWESLHFAAQNSLSNLHVLFDHNKTQALGASKDIYSLHHVESTMSSMGWDVQRQDGHDLEKISFKSTTKKPHFYIFDTLKNKGFETEISPLDAHYKLPGTVTS
jgi:transketolase